MIIKNKFITCRGKLLSRDLRVNRMSPIVVQLFMDSQNSFPLYLFIHSNTHISNIHLKKTNVNVGNNIIKKNSIPILTL